jgi:hypothetical protein
VEGAISAARGQKLSIETFNKVGARLCLDGDPESCVPLASPWLGSLVRTPQAATITDFQRFGLTTSNLEGWFGTGVVLMILALMVAYEHNEWIGVPRKPKHKHVAPNPSATAKTPNR